MEHSGAVRPSCRKCSCGLTSSHARADYRTRHTQSEPQGEGWTVGGSAVAVASSALGVAVQMVREAVGGRVASIWEISVPVS